MNFFTELKRRNVFKVAAAYIIVGWLLLQVSDTLVPALHLPEWFISGVAFALIIGFPIAVIFAWAFEMTPDGLKKEKDVDRSQSITQVTGNKLNNAIIGVLVLTLGYFVLDKFVLGPDRDAAEIASAVQNAQEKVQTPTATEQAEKSIAVLPFVNMSSDREQEYFSDGLSEELLNLLAKIPQLRVAARTSSFSFKGKNLEIPEIASRLKVAHILEGSVRKSGDQIRITAQLIKADDGYHLWSETYDRQLDNVFQIQDEIAGEVVRALKVTLLNEAPKSRETSPEVYQLYLEGQHVRRQVSAPTLPQAINLLKQAVALDPAYAPAWAELAYAYMWEAGIGATPIDEAFALADQAIERALEADPGYSRAYFVKGASQMYNKFNFKAAYEGYQHALELEPGNAFLLGQNATALRAIGRMDRSIALFEQALALDPLMSEMRSWQALALSYAGQLDAAETAYRTVLTLSPDFSGAHYRLGRVLIAQGMPSAALEEIKLEKSSTYSLTGLAMVHHALGNQESSQRALDELIRTMAGHAAYQIAEVYGFRGDSDKAFEWLEESLVIRDSGLVSTLGNPAFYDLRLDPRWQPFLDRLGLLEFWLEMPAEHGGPTK
jgi:TolB-like protein/Tfp pilus assembly protein PilF